MPCNGFSWITTNSAFFFSLLLLLLQRREHYHGFIPGILRVCNRQAQFSLFDRLGWNVDRVAMG